MPQANQSNTAHRESQKRITKMMKITKMVQCLTLSLEVNDLKKIQLIPYFPKLHRVKKCIVRFGLRAPSKRFYGFAISVIQSVFKTLKHLEYVEMSRLGRLQKDPRIFQNLVLQRSLQKLVINPLYYYVKNLRSFMKLSKKASRTKSWPRLKSLRVHLLASEEHGTHTEAPGSLKRLLRFLEDFKSWCAPLYKYSHFQLILPQVATLNPSPKEATAFEEILEIQPPFTHIYAYRGSHITDLFDMAQHLKNLQGLHLQLSGRLSQYLEMSPLKKFRNLQEMSLVVDCFYESYVESPEAYFNYFALQKLQTMTNLRSLTLYFSGNPDGVNDLLRAALSKLSELTYLKLLFGNMRFSQSQGEMTGELNWPWLKEAFQAIGKMKKLKELSLDFETFGFKDSTRYFQSLCQALSRLTQLSSLSLSIREAESIKDQDVCTLASYLNKLTMLESLFLYIGKSLFKSKTFVRLMDSIIKNLVLLSDLDLDFRNFNVTPKGSELIYEAICQMKCLNKINLMIGSQVSPGVNIEFLDAQVHKKMTGGIQCDPSRG